MLTSIPRFAQVVNPDVGPRFVDYESYTRAGVSVRVNPVTQVFLQPQKMTGAQALVTPKLRQPFGYATALAALILPPSDYKLRYDGRSTHVTASALLLGTAPKSPFGYII